MAAAAPALTGGAWEDLSSQAKMDVRQRLARQAAQQFLQGRAGESLWASNAVRLALTTSELKALENDPRVSRVVEDVRMRFLPPAQETPRESLSPQAPGGREKDSSTSWGLAASGAKYIQEQLGLTGTGVVLGHIDSGYDPKVPHFQNSVLRYRNFVDADQNPADDHGHGTHTLGIMVGGKKGQSVAPDAKAFVARALDRTGGGRLSDLLRSLQWMADPDGNPGTRDQPFAVNSSWGVPREELKRVTGSDQFFWDAVQSLREAGVVPVFAVGNDGVGAESVPGGYPHVLSVGAHDYKNRVPEFSSGSLLSWHGEAFFKPDLVAPGVAIRSAKRFSGTKLMQGTSQAAPHVTGILALMKQANPSLTAAQAEKILRATVMDRETPGKDIRAGLGSLQGAEAVRRALGHAGLKPIGKPLPTPKPKLQPVKPRPVAKLRPPRLKNSKLRLPALRRSKRPAPPKIRKAVASAITSLALALGLGMLLFGS